MEILKYINTELYSRPITKWFADEKTIFRPPTSTLQLVSVGGGIQNAFNGRVFHSGEVVMDNATRIFYVYTGTEFLRLS